MCTWAAFVIAIATGESRLEVNSHDDWTRVHGCVRASAIRYYKLWPAATIDACRGKRHYEASILDLLAFIELAKIARVSLAEFRPRLSISRRAVPFDVGTAWIRSASEIERQLSEARAMHTLLHRPHALHFGPLSRGMRRFSRKLEVRRDNSD
jgi:hypothetical protein